MGLWRRDGWGFGVMQGLLVACCRRPRQGEAIIQGDYVLRTTCSSLIAAAIGLFHQPTRTRALSDQPLTILVKKRSRLALAVFARTGARKHKATDIIHVHIPTRLPWKFDTGTFTACDESKAQYSMLHC